MKYFSLFQYILAICSPSQQRSLAFIYICKNKNESDMKY